MILNISKIKTEALLLICRDLILSYKEKNDVLFNVDNELEKFVKDNTNEILRELNKVTKPYEFYIRQKNNSYIKAVLLAYNHLNKLLSSEFKNGVAFNPTMLYFSLLATWFAELQKESKSKEYIYFLLYPYSIVYDKMLLNLENIEFKTLNIKMINIAEKVVLKFDNYKFR